MIERQVDRVCWRIRFDKGRSLTPKRWGITVVSADETRWFGKPTDARTRHAFSSKDAYLAHNDIENTTCVRIDDFEGFDVNQAFDIESYSAYEPQHHLWLVYHNSPTIHVPAMLGASR